MAKSTAILALMILFPPIFIFLPYLYSQKISIQGIIIPLIIIEVILFISYIFSKFLEEHDEPTLRIRIQ